MDINASVIPRGPGKNRSNNKKNSNARGKKSNGIREPRRPDSVSTLSPSRVTSDKVSVSAPLSRQNVRRTNTASTVALANGDIIITHREYLRDINGSADFSSNTLPINPGLATTFPWLSAIAQRFESYRFERLAFMFETESATTQAGTVMLAVDYDSSDAAPASKVQMMAYRSSVRSPPWSDCQLVCLKEDIQKRKSYYVRNGALAANSDVKLYDVGNFFPCTQATTGSPLGELYVEYTVRLMTPQSPPLSSNEAVYGVFGGSSNAAPFATFSGNLPATVVSAGTTNSSSTLTFSQPWEGYVSLILVGTGITSVNLGGTGAEFQLGSLINAAGTQAIVVFQTRCQATQDLTISIMSTTITASALYFGQASI